jgi:hypothetical protein
MRKGNSDHYVISSLKDTIVIAYHHAYLRGVEQKSTSVQRELVAVAVPYRILVVSWTFWPVAVG